MSSPWSDPASQTEPVAYAGPPATAPAPAASGPGWAPAYAVPGHPYPGYDPGYDPGYGPGYGHPAAYGAGWGGSPWGPPVPPRPRRPGQVVAAAVLAFVQATLVAISSAYLLLLVSTLGFLATSPEFGGDTEAEGLVTEATVLTVVQLLSAVALVVAGILVLNRRSRPVWLVLVVAFGVQLALALYWLVRLLVLGGSADDVAGPDPFGVLVGAVLFYAAMPAVGGGLLLAGAVRRWAQGTDPAGAPG